METILAADWSWGKVPLPYKTLKGQLELDAGWGAGVLANSGASRWRVMHVRKFSKGWNAGRVIPGKGQEFIAWGVISKKTFLAYKIEPLSENWSKITPAAFLTRGRKVSITLTLMLIYILPVLAAPFLWHLYEERTLSFSRIYLRSFCKYCMDGRE